MSIKGGALVLSEARKRIPKNKNITLHTIIHDKGYYDIDNNWNSILTFPQYPGMLFRGRVEVFIFDNRNNVFVELIHGHYRIPGGSLERNRSHKYQVSQEAREEARIELGPIDYTGYSYFKFFNKKYYNYPIHWDGSFNEVYIATFKNWYYGPIKNSVRDRGLDKYGRFVPFNYIKNKLYYHHKNALGLIKNT